jgi:curved DNA-binding protein CbpA
MSRQYDYYKILHVRADADPEIIKASYRTLMQKLKQHPDLGGDQANAALINEAYTVLSNPTARAKYDAGLRTGAIRSSTMQSPKSAKQNPNLERIICLFCKLPNVVHKLHPTDKELNCTQCISPLRFVDFDPEWVGPRAARSLKQNMAVSFCLNTKVRELMKGVVEDLSPTGMRFSSSYRLQMGNIIRLDTQEISAVASVMRVQRENDLSVVAVKFLSLKIYNTRGTFISHKV